VADKNVVPLKKGAATPQKTDVDPFLNSEMGVERILPFSYWGDEGEISRNEKVAIDDLVEMRRRDGQARALVRLFVLPILSAFSEGEWQAPEGDEDADKEVQFANDMWSLPPQAGGMTTARTTVLKKMLQGLTDGFAVFEEVRHVPDDGPLKGLITLRKLAYRDPRTLRFRVDDKGGFNGIRQVASAGAKTIDVKIPKEKIFFWTCNAEENPFYGVSMFEAAYEHYVIKKKLYYIAHLAAQFAAVPGRVGEVPKGADPRHVAAFKQSLMNFAFNTAMTVPPDFKVTPFNGNSGFDFIKLIDHHNHMMSKSVLASFLDQEQRTTLIDIGNVDPNTDFFVMALESIMDDIAEQLSMYLMPKYIDWNFGTKKYPVFKFGQLSDAARDAIKDIFNVVVTSTTLNSTPEFVRELEKKLSATLDLDIDYDAIEEQEKQAAEEEAANAANEADAMLEPPSPDGGAAPQPGVAGGGGDQEVPPPGPPQVAMSNPTIDDIVSMAVELLGERPEPEIPDPV
jgi:hypothetical protein